MHRGYIQLFRKFLDFEWYTDVPCSKLYIHLLLKANIKDKRFRGKLVKRGHLLTSRTLLAKETGLTPQQVRTALEKMSPDHIVIEATTQGTDIFVVDFEDYNGGSSVVNRNNGQRQHQRSTNGATNVYHGESDDISGTYGDDIDDCNQRYHQRSTGSSTDEQPANSPTSNQQTLQRTTSGATNVDCDESDDISGICDDDYDDSNQRLHQRSTSDCANVQPAGQPLLKKQKKQKKHNSSGQNLAEPSSATPDSDKVKSDKGKKPIKPPEHLNEKQAAFYQAFLDTEFFVVGKGYVKAIEGIADPVRLAEKLGDENLFPAVDVGLVERLGGWTTQNTKRAKKDVGRFLYNRASAAQDYAAKGGNAGGSRGGATGYRGNYQNVDPEYAGTASGDLEARVKSER